MRPLALARSLFATAITITVLLGPSWTPPARAEMTIRLDRGNFQPLPIAIVDFAGEAELGQKISGIVTSNLKRCGYFVPIDKAAFGDRAINFDAAPQFGAWKSINAQALVTGRVTRDGSGRLKAEFRLWDVTAGQQLDGQQYFADANNWRRIGHIISDAIFSRLTGLKGLFDTRIVFVEETGPKENRRKRLAIMDQDGANVRYLTGGEELVVSPRYSPRSQDVAFMSQSRGQQPRVQVLNIDTRQREVVGNFNDMTSSPRFSPDGQRILMSYQQGGNANIFLIDMNSRTTTKLTTTNAIDTSPSFSPDGSRITFESDRHGSQQVYVMNADGSGQQRISFGDGSYSQPVWSPRGDFIAFTKRRAGGFAIGIMKPDGSGERILTEGFHNEGPSWAPNGQFLLFWRDPGGEGGGKMYMVDVTGRVETPVPTPGYASDPAWSPLLKSGD